MTCVSVTHGEITLLQHVSAPHGSTSHGHRDWGRKRCMRARKTSERRDARPTIARARARTHKRGGPTSADTHTTNERGDADDHQAPALVASVDKRTTNERGDVDDQRARRRRRPTSAERCRRRATTNVSARTNEEPTRSKRNDVPPCARRATRYAVGSTPLGRAALSRKPLINNYARYKPRNALLSIYRYYLFRSLNLDGSIKL